MPQGIVQNSAIHLGCIVTLPLASSDALRRSSDTRNAHSAVLDNSVDCHMLKPALLYFALTFAVGFLLGSFRMLILVPRVGEVAAVLIECPIILLASFFIARWVLRRFSPHATAVHRLLIGLLAFAMLMSTELLMSSLRGISPQEFASALLKAPGAIGLAGQTLFALMPLFIGTRSLHRHTISEHTST